VVLFCQIDFKRYSDAIQKDALEGKLHGELKGILVKSHLNEVIETTKNAVDSPKVRAPKKNHRLIESDGEEEFGGAPPMEKDIYNTPKSGQPIPESTKPKEDDATNEGTGCTVAHAIEVVDDGHVRSEASHSYDYVVSRRTFRSLRSKKIWCAMGKMVGIG